MAKKYKEVRRKDIDFKKERQSHDNRKWEKETHSNF